MRQAVRKVLLKESKTPAGAYATQLEGAVRTKAARISKDVFGIEAQYEAAAFVWSSDGGSGGAQPQQWADHTYSLISEDGSGNVCGKKITDDYPPSCLQRGSAWASNFQAPGTHRKSTYAVIYWPTQIPTETPQSGEFWRNAFTSRTYKSTFPRSLYQLRNIIRDMKKAIEKKYPGGGKSVQPRALLIASTDSLQTSSGVVNLISVEASVELKDSAGHGLGEGKLLFVVLPAVATLEADGGGAGIGQDGGASLGAQQGQSSGQGMDESSGAAAGQVLPRQEIGESSGAGEQQASEEGYDRPLYDIVQEGINAAVAMFTHLVPDASYTAANVIKSAGIWLDLYCFFHRERDDRERKECQKFRFTLAMWDPLTGFPLGSTGYEGNSQPVEGAEGSLPPGAFTFFSHSNHAAVYTSPSQMVSGGSFVMPAIIAKEWKDVMVIFCGTSEASSTSSTGPHLRSILDPESPGNIFPGGNQYNWISPTEPLDVTAFGQHVIAQTTLQINDGSAQPSRYVWPRAVHVIPQPSSTSIAVYHNEASGPVLQGSKGYTYYQPDGHLGTLVLYVFVLLGAF